MFAPGWWWEGVWHSFPFLAWDLRMQPRTQIWFLNQFICTGACACSSNLDYAHKCIENSWNLACYHGAVSTCRGKIFVSFGADLGISFSQTIASHNKPDGFGTECATFGDEKIFVASYCFQKNSSANIEQHECCVNFWNFSWFVWTFLYINGVF